ncbi:hypothetical protein D9M73_235400 [compost metagenome]
MPKRACQPLLPLNGSEKPRGWPASIAEEIGICVMVCTPPTATTSCMPLMTAWAAKCTACWDDPHWRSTVVPGTFNGRPAASQLVRAMSPACEPMVSTQPKITSS